MELVRRWYGVGTALVRRWYGVGMELVWSWYGRKCMEKFGTNKYLFAFDNI
jgi:hypothetical protein